MPCLLLFAVIEAHRVFSADSVVLADKGLALVRQVGTGRELNPRPPRSRRPVLLSDQERNVVSKYHCYTISITCSRVLNSSPDR